MYAQQQEGLPELAKVIDLSEYRRDKPHFSPSRSSAASAVNTHARVYVDLDLRGHIEYGLAHADIENALFLLEPTLYLAGQLLKIAIDEEP